MNRYFIIYKPYLVLSQFSEVPGKKTLADFFDLPKDVYPVGRLDYDSEGLLLLTNDTTINHRLLHPKFLHEREYWVQVDGAISPQALKQLSEGVTIAINGKAYTTQPCRSSLFEETPPVPERHPPIRFRKEIPAPWIRLILTEGKNRQVRKMTAQAGYPTLRLIRYRINQVQLGNMEPGNRIELNAAVVYKKLFNESP